MAERLRFLLVDDHEIVRNGVRALIESEPGWEVVAEVERAADAVTVASATKPDLAIVDLHLPDGNGVEVCRGIRDLGLPIRTLVFSSDADDDALLAAVMAGADGYVLKHVGAGRLLEVIHDLVAGKPLLDARMHERIVRRLTSRPDHPVSIDGLSVQEQRVLDLVAEGLTNRQIGEQLVLAEKTVKNYVSNVLAKLGVSRRSEAAVRRTLVEERAADHTRAPSGDPVRW